MYTTIFLVELVLRIIDERLKFFWWRGRDACWNYLDTFIVVSSLVEVFLAFLLDNEAETSQLRMFKVIRICRLMKILRLGRLLQFIRALRTLVYSIVHTLK